MSRNPPAGVLLYDGRMAQHPLAVAAFLLAISAPWLPAGGIQPVSASGAETPAYDLPRPVDYVSDFAHVLSHAAVDEIDRICSDLDHSNADTQVAVVTIKSLKGADVADYATKLANAWGIGRKGSNRGVLILLAVNDHKWRIAVGRGLEPILTPSKTEEIGQKMAPPLASRDFNGAAAIAVREIAQAVAPPKALGQR